MATGDWAGSVWNGLSACGARSGLIPWGKAEMQDSVFLPGPRGGQQRSVCLCEVCHLPSCISPSSQLVKLAKRLKKEKVNVDIINFGEEVSKDQLGALLDLVVA